jgi:hypothetical protein
MPMQDPPPLRTTMECHWHYQTVGYSLYAWGLCSLSDDIREVLAGIDAAHRPFSRMLSKVVSHCSFVKEKRKGFLGF